MVHFLEFLRKAIKKDLHLRIYSFSRVVMATKKNHKKCQLCWDIFMCEIKFRLSLQVVNVEGTRTLFVKK